MRRRLMMKDLRLMIFLFVSVFLINHQSLFINHAFAVDSSPSAEIAEKLKEFQKEAASKAAKLKDLITRKLQNKAYIGNVESFSGSSLTLSVFSGPKIVSTNQDTIFESNVKGKKYSGKSIETGNYIAALGDIDETGVLTAKKIVLLPSPKPEPKTFIWGRIISVSDKLTTIRTKNLKNVSVDLPASSKTVLNDSIILTGSKDKNDVFKADFVYVIATPSASN